MLRGDYMKKTLEKALEKLLEIRALIALMLTACTVVLAIMRALTPEWLTLYTGSICAYFFTDKYKQRKDDENNAEHN